MLNVKFIMVPCISSVEEQLNRAIDDIRAVEEEKRENAIAEERRVSEELRATLEELRTVSILIVN